MTTVHRIAAFSDGNTGGNPAGVWIGDAMPDASRMQAIAAEVGFSETAFAAPEGDAWRVRYFSPAMEVPFCGHATIALGRGPCAPAWRPQLRAASERCRHFRVGPPRRQHHCGGAAIAADAQCAARAQAAGCAAGPVRLRDLRSRPQNSPCENSRRRRSCRACADIARGARAHGL